MERRPSWGEHKPSEVFAFVKTKMSAVGSSLARIVSGPGHGCVAGAADVPDPEGAVVDPAWFRLVDAVIAPEGSLASHFYSSAVTTLLGLTANVAITQSMFMSDMRRQYVRLWTQPFQHACEFFFHESLAALPSQPRRATFTLRLPESHGQFALFDQRLRSEELRARFVGSKHGRSVASAMLTQLGRPSIFLYNSAVQVLLDSHDTAADAEAFIHNIKITLGTTGGWSEELTDPIAVWYECAREAGADNLQRLPLPPLECEEEEEEGRGSGSGKGSANYHRTQPQPPTASSNHVVLICIPSHRRRLDLAPSVLTPPPHRAVPGSHDERDVSGAAAALRAASQRVVLSALGPPVCDDAALLAHAQAATLGCCSTRLGLGAL